MYGLPALTFQPYCTRNNRPNYSACFRVKGVSIIVGIAAWLDALGSILFIPIIFAIGLGGVLLLIPIWSLSFGIDLLRSSIN